MIKFTKRRNIIYIFQFTLWTYARVLIKLLINLLFKLNRSSLLCFLKFFGQLSSGIIVYRYQSKYLRKKGNAQKNNIMLINTRTTENEQIKTNKFKIYLLLFFAGFFDFVQYIMAYFYIVQISNISPSLDSRLYSFLVICNFLTYRYLLHFKIFKHQKFSLILIFICLIITIASEYGFQNINEFFTYNKFTESLLLILIEYFILSMTDIIDKYLLEFESIDPFYIIIIEGIFGSIFSLLFFIIENPLEDLRKVYNSSSILSFCFFIFLLFLFYLFNALASPFRIMVNKLYSPMVITLSDYFLNPIYIVINFFTDDFKSKEGQNIFYFVINLFLSSITAFCTCIYNEFIVLFCFGLEKDTHDQITKRSLKEEIEISEILIETQKDEESNSNEDKNETYKIYV